MSSWVISLPEWQGIERKFFGININSFLSQKTRNMGREMDQVGSSGEEPIGKVASGGPRRRKGEKPFPGKNKNLRNNPGNIRNKFTGRSSYLSGYVFDMK